MVNVNWQVIWFHWKWHVSLWHPFTAKSMWTSLDLHELIDHFEIITIDKELGYGSYTPLQLYHPLLFCEGLPQDFQVCSLQHSVTLLCIFGCCVACGWAVVAPRSFHFIITALTVDHVALAGLKVTVPHLNSLSYSLQPILLLMFIYGNN